METKIVIFDGGPLDGEMRAIKKNQTRYVCQTYGYQRHIATEHLYEEDPKVEGHFIYKGTLSN